MEPPLLVVALHDREDRLDRLVLGPVRDVPDYVQPQVLVELLVGERAMYAEVVLEDGERAVAVLGPELAQEPPVRRAVDRALVDEEVLDLALGGDGGDGGVVLGVQHLLVDAEVHVLVAVVAHQDGPLGESHLVYEDHLELAVECLLELRARPDLERLVLVLLVLRVILALPDDLLPDAVPRVEFLQHAWANPLVRVASVEHHRPLPQRQARPRLQRVLRGEVVSVGLLQLELLILPSMRDIEVLSIRGDLLADGDVPGRVLEELPPADVLHPGVLEADDLGDASVSLIDL